MIDGGDCILDWGLVVFDLAIGVYFHLENCDGFNCCCVIAKYIHNLHHDLIGARLFILVEA